MHKISGETMQAAQLHAQTILRDGKSVEKLGKNLQINDQNQCEVGKNIEAHGKNIQKHAKKSFEKVEQLLEEESTEVFLETVQEHIDAAQIHIQAVKEFQKHVIKV